MSCVLRFEAGTLIRSLRVASAFVFIIPENQTVADPELVTTRLPHLSQVTTLYRRTNVGTQIPVPSHLLPIGTAHSTAHWHALSARLRLRFGDGVD